MIIGQVKGHAMGQKVTKMLTCGGVVGADEPLQMGLSSQLRSPGLADGSKMGSGQRSKALRKFDYCRIDFHRISVIFPTRER